MRLLDAGKVSSMLEHTITLEEVPSALEKLSQRHVKGKIVAKIK
ncbi:zinc-binding dehydrogenase [Thalassobacillus hwangdonensis]|uniref:Zinc-binding dehydrogenase n=1 Tax=Thalassobacillus hwangdonensis TaxID=546108 RepID=A0ABW3L3Q9_9BACI